METQAPRASSQRPTLEQWFTNPVQVLATSEAFHWSHVTLRYAQLNPSHEYRHTPQVQDHALIFVVKGVTHMQGHFVDGSRFFERVVPGMIQVVPPLLNGVSRWDTQVTAAFVLLSHELIMHAADAAAQGDPERIEILPLFSIYDPFLYQLMSELHAEVENSSPFGTVFAESVGQTMAVHLLRKYSTASIRSQTPKGTLTPSQIHDVQEYIQEHLDQRISLAQLADCIHVSIPHFERMFRATLRRPPYRYILECRIERAKRLLRETHLPLYEVACQCGFANQSHFTKHFTRFGGTSPARYRAETRR